VKPSRLKSKGREGRKEKQGLRGEDPIDLTRACKKKALYLRTRGVIKKDKLRTWWLKKAIIQSASDGGERRTGHKKMG